MKNKEINLLPEYARFDINKHYLLKKFFLIIIFNIIFLALISTNLFFEKRFLKNKILEEKAKLKKLTSLVEGFKNFQIKYSKLLKKLNSLNKKKELYYLTSHAVDSPFLSFMIFGKCITDGIKINEIEYSSGEFVIKGNSLSPESFYNFYNSLSNNKLIKKVNFYYLQQKKDMNIFNFKVALIIKEIK